MNYHVKIAGTSPTEACLATVDMSEETQQRTQKRDLDWLKVLWYIHLHAFGLYGVFVLFTQAKWFTVLFAVLIIIIANLGLTAGAHRLWAHRTYQARAHIKFFLMLAHTMAGVGPIHDWVLAHRIHHEFYGTDKDPYNHNRGFMYSHVISNLATPHPDHEKIAQDIDIRDLELDGYVWFQRRFYWPLFLIVGLLLPINAPAEYWGETLFVTFFVLGFLRLTLTLHLSWLVNSALLIWGLKPTDKFPANDNSVFIVTRSYWPNYHYLLSWDYKSGEYGTYDSGLTSLVLNFWASLGSISLMKTGSSKAIREALYRAATSKTVTVNEALEDVKNSAEWDAHLVELSYRH